MQESIIEPVNQQQDIKKDIIISMFIIAIIIIK